MSLRIASRALARPMGVARPSMMAVRMYSTEQPDPKQKAQSIIEALPGNNAVSKTGILATGSAAAIYALSNGIYVVNAESLMLGAFAGVFYILSKTAAPAYGEWAKGHVETFKNVLSQARQGHVQAVQQRIDDVSQYKNVVDTTKQLFQVSKETAQLESEVFEQKQRVHFAEQAKAVLDSWVRYEGQMRQREQQELAESVLNKVNKEVANPKFKQQVLEQALTDVEKVLAAKK